MSAVIDFLAEHGSTLSLGVTAVLGIGWLVALVVPQPIHKQRLAEIGVIAALLWLGLAVAPWPRTKPASLPDSNNRINRLTVHDRPSFQPMSLDPPRILSDLPNFEPTSPIDLAPRAAEEPVDHSGSSTREVATSEPTLENEPLRFGPILATLYLVSTALGLAALAMAWLRLRRLVHRSNTSSAMVLDIWRDLHPPRRAHLLVGSATPLSFGIWKPTVLVPASLAEQGGAELEAVLRHELAHVRHGDAVGRTVFNVAMPILALHPFYWLLRRQAMFAAELRADAGAAEPVGAGRYVESLVALFNHSGRPRRLLAASTVWASESEFCRRMTMLLKRDRTLSQRTSWTWRTGVAAVAAAVVTLSANQFGVVYAQSAKAKSDPANNPTVEVALELVKNKFDPLSQDSPKTSASPQGSNPFDRTSDAPGPKTTTMSPSLVAQDAKTSRFNATQKEGAANPWIAPGTNGGDAWNALTLQIADRRARLAAAQVSPDAAPWQRLQLEVEIIHLECAKRIAGYEQELRLVEGRLLQVASEAEEAGAELGVDHPTQKKLQRTAAGLEKRREMLKRLIEEESLRAQQRVSGQTERYKQQVQPMESRMTKAPAKSSLAKSIQSTSTNKVESERQSLSANLQHALQENAMLRDQIAALNKIATDKSPSLAPTTDFNRSNLEFSAPMIRHRLRMAEADVPIHEKKVSHHEAQWKRTEALHKTGNMSKEEVANAETQVYVAKAELAKAMTEIASLRTLLKELDSEAAAKRSPGPAK